MDGVRVLVIEDEPMLRRTLLRKLEREGCQMGSASNGEEARKILREDLWDLVLLDIKLPDADGLVLLDEIHREHPDMPVIMTTGNRLTETVVEAMKRGATNYITKPYNLDELMITIKKALELSTLRSQTRGVQAAREEAFRFDKVIGASTQMGRVLDISKTVARSQAETVLLLGESGTGKNLLAQAIHFNSSRAPHPFMEITCTALPEPLLESELFGHERGAFTDARATKKGLCEIAHRGTLFLDEIGDLPLGTQAKLLGFMESRRFRRVGGTRLIEVDLRIIAATNQDLQEKVRQKLFREDLFYRLNVIEINIPPLRDRPEDILVLAESFIQHFNQKFNKRIRGLDKDAARALREYSWPGNVRELRNAIERAMILSAMEWLDLDNFPLKTKQVAPLAATGKIVLPEGGIGIDDVEKELVVQALSRSGNNQSQAAKLLRLSRDQFRYRMKQYNLL